MVLNLDENSEILGQPFTFQGVELVEICPGNIFTYGISNFVKDRFDRISSLRVDFF